MNNGIGRQERMIISKMALLVELSEAECKRKPTTGRNRQWVKRRTDKMYRTQYCKLTWNHVQGFKAIDLDQQVGIRGNFAQALHVAIGRIHGHHGNKKNFGASTIPCAHRVYP
ncbi:hypothetical protein ACA910_013523 [Epithemia clementina (nom. ined.)]